MLTLETIGDERRFAGLRAEWDGLLRGSAADCVFLTWEWLFTWWRQLGGRRRLSLLAVREHGELVGLAPLCLRPGRPLATLELLGGDEVGSDYLDLLARPGCEARVLETLASHLGERRLVLRLRRFTAGRALAAGLAERLAARGYRPVGRGVETCPFIPLAGKTWESYVDGLGREHRANLRRRLRALERAGARFEQVEGEEQRREVLAALVSLHNRRWDERGGSQAFHRPALVAFHEEWSRLALQRGWLRLYALRLQGRIVAALYGFLRGGRFSFYQSGFDAADAGLSPGLAVMGLAIRSALAEGALEYDLLHGDEAYKFLWCREARELADLELYPPTAAGFVARSLARAESGARRTARRTLPPGLVAALRAAERAWRARSVHAATAG